MKAEAIKFPLNKENNRAERYLPTIYSDVCNAA